MTCPLSCAAASGLGSVRNIVPAILSLLIRLLMAASTARAADAVGVDPYLTFSANIDVGYRKTQLFAANQNVGVGQWDTRAEGWLPPFRTGFSWGPYVRLAGINASEIDAWQNAWFARPGFGFQVYPFSAVARDSRNELIKILGPLRLFAEYNRLNYWGETNEWRPKKQSRFGAEHWRALHVNNVASFWWAETWNGLSWQSANEFSPSYRSVIFANAVRTGLRVPDRGALSAFTPYVALESSVTDNPYHWENRLLAGGGIRFAPSIRNAWQKHVGLNRFGVYAEYLKIGAHYRDSAPSNFPRHDIRIGLTFSVGEWYR